MRKYSKSQIHKMAQIAIAAKDQGDPRYAELVAFVSGFTGCSITETDARIAEMARGVFRDATD